jgi:hypothetical protein
MTPQNSFNVQSAIVFAILSALIALGITGPARYRKQQQALLAWKEKYPPRPWPSRTKGTG